MKMIRLVLLAAMIAVAPVTGCASFLASLPVVASVITDAFAVLEIIDTAAKRWFLLHPEQDDVQRAYLDAYARAIAALNAANHTLSGVKNVSQEEFDAAFAEFRQAYAELRSVLQKHRLMQQDRMSVSSTETVIIPTPQALTYEIK